jgi:tRNA A-37 threonylcarbamoyl transferase component Bud32
VYPEFVRHTRGSASIWVNRDLAASSFSERLTDVDQLLCEPTCQIIKDQRKIKVGRLTIDIAGTHRTIYIKRYNAFSLRYKLASPFIRSGAFRALHGAAILREIGISTAAPLAAVENRIRGALTKSFFISEEITGGKTADAYWRDELQNLHGRNGIERRNDFLASLARLFRALHAQQIYHNDLKDANILAVTGHAGKSVAFFLLDLEGVKRYAQLSEKRRVKNLVQLNRTLGRYIPATGKLAFVKNYLAASFAERKLRRRLVENVLRESNRLDAMKTWRVKAKLLRIG